MGFHPSLYLAFAVSHAYLLGPKVDFHLTLAYLSYLMLRMLMLSGPNADLHAICVGSNHTLVHAFRVLRSRFWSEGRFPLYMHGF